MKTTQSHTAPDRPELSFDGCGINGPDEYRTRLCAFAEKRGEIANHYGPLFEAAPKMLEALRDAEAELTRYIAFETATNPRVRYAGAAAPVIALRDKLRAAIAQAEGRK